MLLYDKVNKVLIFDAGTVVDEGTLAQLQDRNSKYFQEYVI